jgi:hypothetical protein
MREQSAGKAASENYKLTGWFNWMGRHPGVVLLGAVVMAILTLQDSPAPEGTEGESSDEEVPLFI